MTDAATSIAQMVIEWVDGGIAMGTDWRPGLASIISKRLVRFSQNEEIPWLLKELDEKDAEIAALRQQLAEAQALHERDRAAKATWVNGGTTTGPRFDPEHDAKDAEITALRARVETLEQIARDARPFCLGLGEGFADGCAVANRIDAALSGKE